MHTAETAKRHKMQKVAELAQLTPVDKSTEKLIGSNGLSHQTSETVKPKKKWEKLAKLACLPLNCTQKNAFCFFAANHADLSFISLNVTFWPFLWPNYTFLSFFAPKTCFRLFAVKLGLLL